MAREYCGISTPDSSQLPARAVAASAIDPAPSLLTVRWALADGMGTVLDPSYGGCAFLDAAVGVLKEEHPDNPGGRVYGVDVDPECVDTVKQSVIDANCLVTDFLGTSPADFPGSPFSAVVGNPPYVRHHWIKGNQRDSAQAVVAASTVPLPATANLWAYFLLHSLNFLAPGGRLAILVPEAILQADYAIPLRDALAERFGRSRLIYIRDRLFDGTDEPVVVVACADFGGRGEVGVEAIECVNDLEAVLSDANGPGHLSRLSGARGQWAGAKAMELLGGPPRGAGVGV